jgi:molybdopterin-guanine dinucleotide biosynthesis protein A
MFPASPDTFPASPENTIGILLAGGRAARMGGGDKSLKLVGGMPILARVISRLQPQCESLILNANGDAGRFAAFGLTTFADDVPDFPGPLAGILAGLDFIATHSPETRWALSIATDTPFLPDDLVRRLHASRTGDDMLACARSGTRIHPIIALWPVVLRHDLRHALINEELRKVEAFISRYPVAYAEWNTEPFDPFFNANRPQDLVEAEIIAAKIDEACA